MGQKYTHEYYAQNRASFLERSRKWRAKNRDKVRASNERSRAKPGHKELVRKLNAKKNVLLRSKLDRLKDVPCADCEGWFPPECMDFDHVRGIKAFDVCKPDSMGKRLDDEISKCDVICANCHRIRTRKRNQYRRVEPINPQTADTQQVMDCCR